MKTKFFIILTLIAIFATACFDFSGKEIRRCDFTEAQDMVVPYEKGQVISFIYDKGQVIDLIVTEIEQQWNQYGVDGGMIEDYITYKFKQIELKSDVNNMEIIFNVTAVGCLSGEGENCEIKIFLNPYKGYFMFDSDKDGNFMFFSSFHDSIEINSKVYCNVGEAKFNRDVLDSTSPPFQEMQLFYNKEYGILQINRDSENFLTLKN